MPMTHQTQDLYLVRTNRLYRDAAYCDDADGALAITGASPPTHQYLRKYWFRWDLIPVLVGCSRIESVRLYDVSKLRKELSA